MRDTSAVSNRCCAVCRRETKLPPVTLDGINASCAVMVLGRRVLLALRPSSAALRRDERSGATTTPRSQQIRTGNLDDRRYAAPDDCLETGCFAADAGCCRRVSGRRDDKACTRPNGESCPHRHDYDSDAGRTFRCAAKTEQTKLDRGLSRTDSHNL